MLNCYPIILFQMRININKDNNFIASLDITDFYLLVSYKMIKMAIWYFANNFDESEKRRLANSLTLLKFGMSHQIL